MLDLSYSDSFCFSINLLDLVVDHTQSLAYRHDFSTHATLSKTYTTELKVYGL